MWFISINRFRTSCMHFDERNSGKNQRALRKTYQKKASKLFGWLANVIASAYTIEIRWMRLWREHERSAAAATTILSCAACFEMAFGDKLHVKLMKSNAFFVCKQAIRLIGISPSVRFARNSPSSRYGQFFVYLAKKPCDNAIQQTTHTRR